MSALLAHPRVIGALRLLFVAVLAVALVLALRPGVTDPFPSIWDKWKHMAAFAALAAIGAFAFPRVPLGLLGERLSFFGALIEIAQAAPQIGRDCDWKDWVADTIAIVVVLLFVRVSALRDAAERPEI